MTESGSEAHYFTDETSTESFLAQAESIAFWEVMNPSMHITDNPFHEPLEPYEFTTEEVEQYLEMIKEDGYLQTRVILPEFDCQIMAQAVLKVIASGFHPNFVMVYDEFWRVFRRLSGLLGPVLGSDYEVMAQFWVWCIEPAGSKRGWKPHRDYTYVDSLRPDGIPSVVTVWMPLTDAVPLNGCIYVLPTSLDSNFKRDPENETVDNVQNVRCLPAKAGSVLVWNQHILHWGGRCSPRAPHARISVAMYAKSKEVCGCYPGCEVDFSSPLPFNHRLAFIGGEFLRYRGDSKFPEGCIRFAKKIWYRKQLSEMTMDKLQELRPDPKSGAKL